jgi:flagellin FlaB
MLKRWFRSLTTGQRGITGLETAIILIAFVMVASVFSYVVLTAGLFSAQKAKEAVHSGLEEVRSTLELKGDVILKMEEGFGTELMLTLGMAGSEPVDLTDTTEDKNVVVITYTDDFQNIPSLDWTITKLNTSKPDSMLDPGELFLVTVDLSAVNDGADGDAQKLGAYHKFTVEVKPPKGAVLTIERTVPARVSQLVNLH